MSKCVPVIWTHEMKCYKFDMASKGCVLATFGVSCEYPMAIYGRQVIGAGISGDWDSCPIEENKLKLLLQATNFRLRLLTLIGAQWIQNIFIDVFTFDIHLIPECQIY